MTFKLTAEQERCVDYFVTGQSLRINAYAGCGKTSTLKELARASNGRGGTYIAFNKSIADDARSGFPSTVACSTVHSLAFRALVRTYGSEKMTGSINAGLLVAKKLITSRDLPSGIASSTRGIAYLVVETIKRFCQSDRREISARDVPVVGVLERIAEENVDVIKRHIARVATGIWAQMTDAGTDLPLGHDGYLKVWALTDPVIPGKFLFLDEAQDTNGVVLGVVRSQGSQIVCVGDEYQQIYAWRGATNAMRTLPADHSAMLTTSWRFGPQIAAFATRILGTMGAVQPLQGNPDRVSRIGAVAEPDTILTRSNAALLTILADELEAGGNPYIVGGTSEMERMLDATIKLQQGKSVEFPLDFFGFENWDQVVEASEEDGGDDLKKWVQIINRFGSVPLKQRLKATARDEKGATVILSTAHKSKGREWKRVRLYSDLLKLKPGPDGSTNPPEEELRLFYVAATRGIDEIEVAFESEDSLRKIETAIAAKAPAIMAAE